MKSRDRFVDVTPLQALWTDAGELLAKRGRLLDREGIRDLLRRGPVRFVVARVGHPLRWVPVEEQLEFWKRSVLGHLAEGERFHLDDFPDGVAYVASEWLSGDHQEPIVLLEVHH